MIIGVTGTNGAGKGTVVDYLKGKGFTHYSVRECLVKEIERRGMPVDRNSMNVVGNELRAQHGAGYFAEQLLGQALGGDANAVIESIRTPGEAQFLQSRGAVIWAVDADRQARYERSVLRGTGTDHVTFEEFCMQEDRELASPDSHKHNVSAVMQMADAILYNNGPVEELFAQVDVALQKK